MLDAESDRFDEMNSSTKGETAFDTTWSLEVIHTQRDALRALIATMMAVTVEDAAVQIATASHLADDLTSKDLREYETHQASAAMDRLLLSALPVVAAVAGLDMGAHGWGDLDHIRPARFAGVEGVR